jgi:hypothetical protein
MNEDGAFGEYWCALVITTLPENSGNLDLVSKYVQVRTAPAVFDVKLFCMGNVVSCAHILPEIATTSKTGDERIERWIINRCIHLATSYDVYQ